MKRKMFIGVALLSAAVGLILAAGDKYTVKVPGGLAFSEFKGYESWTGDEMKATLEINAPNYARVILSTQELIASIHTIGT